MTVGLGGASGWWREEGEGGSLDDAKLQTYRITEGYERRLNADERSIGFHHTPFQNDQAKAADEERRV